MAARRGRLIPGIIALVVLVGIGTALGAGDLSHDSPSKLQGPDVASQLSLGIQSQQSASTTPVVTCPSSEPVRAGYSFTCKMQPWKGSRARTLTVTEIDGRGHLRWTMGGP